MILCSTKFQCRMDEGNWNFVLFHKMALFILYVLVRFLTTLHIFLSFLGYKSKFEVDSSFSVFFL